MNRFWHLTLVFILILIGCTPQQEKSRDDLTVIAGHIAPADGQLVVLSQNERFVAGTSLEDGMFYLEVPDAEGYYFLNHGDHRIPIFIAPNFHLNLSFDTRQGLRSVRFQGRGKEVNQYLCMHEEFRRNNEPNWDTLWNESKKHFSEHVNRYRVKNEAFLNHYLAKNTNLDPRFIERERNRVLYSWVNLLLAYDDQVIASVDQCDLFMGGQFLEFIPEVSMEDPELLLLPEYKQFLQHIVQRYSHEEHSQQASLTRYEVAFDIINKNIFEEEIRSYLAYEVMKDYLQTGVDEDRDAIHTIFRKMCKDGEMLAQIRQAMEHLAPVKNGAPLVHFAGTDITGTQVSEVALQGQVVFIDVWATWCQSCRQELSDLDSLRSEFRKEDISFVSLSLDEDHTSWTKFLQERSMGGIQLIMKDGWNSRFRKRFLIESVPHYILIDRKGMIVNANAPSPSSPEIRRQIQSLLETS